MGVRIVKKRTGGGLDSLKKKIQANAKKVHVNVGINEAQGATAMSGSAVNLATIALYQEYGWVQRVTKAQSGFFYSMGLKVSPGTTLFLPPRPFLRATLDWKSKDWARLGSNAFVKYGYDTEKALALLGMVAVDDIKATILNGGTPKARFALRSDLTMELYRRQSEGKSKDGAGNVDSNKPLVLTGRLLNAISFELV